MEKLKNFLNTLDKPSILDVGTGSGNFIQLLTSVYEDFGSIVGIDTLQIAVDSASKNFPDERISFTMMDAHSMTFEDHSFDLVCLSNSLHHLKDPQVIFKEMERVLKPGGFILINEMMSDDLSVKQIAHLKIHHFAAEIDRVLGDTHNDTFKRQEILDVLKRTSSLEIKDHWDMDIERRNENTQEEVDWLVSTVDRLIARLKNETLEEQFRSKGQEVKDYIQEHGFDSATQLLVTLQ